MDKQKTDKVPRTYNQQPFSLDGQLDLEVSLGDKVMKTAIYLKRGAHDQLLLSEGVCRQLGIISYPPFAEPWRRGKKALLLEKEVKVPRVTSETSHVTPSVVPYRCNSPSSSGEL